MLVVKTQHEQHWKKILQHWKMLNIVYALAVEWALLMPLLNCYDRAMKLLLEMICMEEHIECSQKYLNHLE